MPKDTVVREDDLTQRVPLENAFPFFKVSGKTPRGAKPRPEKAVVTPPEPKDRPSYDDDCDSDGEFPGVPQDPPLSGQTII